eukprot:scaffold13560_cov163-Skeletonema_dohrnii-CCMP3373.AAC.2
MIAFFGRGKKLDRIWPEQQKSPTSTSSNFNLLHQTHHNAILYHIIPNQPQEAATSSSTELGSGIAAGLGTARYLLGHTRQQHRNFRINTIFVENKSTVPSSRSANRISSLLYAYALSTQWQSTYCVVRSQFHGSPD